jgi:hypothetical protein
MIIYTDLVRRIVEDIAPRVRDFQHLEPDRIGFLASPRSSGHPTGNLATTYSLRQNPTPTFSIWTRRGSRNVFAVSEWFQYRAPRIRLGGRDMTYLVLLRLPRLLMRNPLPILIHELYHIGERFDYDMRPAHHGPAFDREVRRLSGLWLARQKGELARLAQLRHHELQREFGAVLAHGVPSRFVIPTVEPVERPESYERAIGRLYPDYRLASRFEIRPVDYTPDEVPRYLSEKDLVLRHYTARGCERIPNAFARYSQRYLALTA